MREVPEAIREAAARVRQGIDPSRRAEWLDFLRGNGLALWPATYGKPGVENDLQALRALVEYVQELPDGERKSLLTDLVTIPSCAQELLSDCLWVDQACPIVQTTHRWAAAAICTTLPPNLELKTPWRCWVLEIPDRLLWVEDPELHIRTWLRYALVRVLKSEVGPRWSITGMGDSSIVQVGARSLTQEELLSASPTGDQEGQDTALDWPLDQETDRVIACLKSLVANLLVAMSDPQWCRPVGKHHPGWTRGPARDGSPQHRRFLVAKPTRIDVRQEVTRYCRGGRQPSKVQTLVRGHWRTYLHGPRKSLRRLQWLEPFWRGNLEAPISSPILIVDGERG